MKPATTSPAVDKGGIHTLLSESAFDQRGLGRPFDVSSVGNSGAAGADATDIGAVELQAGDYQVSTPPPQTTPNTPITTAMIMPMAEE